jgi:hypothetical protein
MYTILCVFKLFYVEGVCSQNAGKQNMETSPLTRLDSDVTIFQKETTTLPLIVIQTAVNHVLENRMT